MALQFTLQPVTLTGNLMGHTIGVFATQLAARTKLRDAGFYQRGHSDVWAHAAKACAYHVTVITDNEL